MYFDTKHERPLGQKRNVILQRSLSHRPELDYSFHRYNIKKNKQYFTHFDNIN